MKRYEMEMAETFDMLAIESLNGPWVKFADHEAAIADAVEVEREACARVCKILAMGKASDSDSPHARSALRCETAIRARSKP